MMYGYGGSFGLGIPMFLSMLLPIIVIVGVIYLVFSLLERKKSAPADQSRPDPLNTLKERFARGDITREEFLSMKEDLL